jgi:hypothetical protein
VIVPVLFLVFLISIPYLDREDHNQGIWFSGFAGRKLAWHSLIYSLIVTVIFVFILVRYGWLRSWFPEMPQVVIMLVNPATLSALLYILWAEWLKQKTGSSRMSAIALFTCTMTGLIIFTAMGIWFRGPNWEFYWSSSQWPVF